MRRELRESLLMIAVIGLSFWVFVLYQDLHGVKMRLTSAKQMAFESAEKIDAPGIAFGTNCGAEVEVTCTGRVRDETPMHLVRYHCDPDGCNYECGNEK